jgi:hypothetical protein
VQTVVYKHFTAKLSSATSTRSRYWWILCGVAEENNEDWLTRHQRAMSILLVTYCKVATVAKSTQVKTLTTFSEDKRMILLCISHRHVML